MGKTINTILNLTDKFTPRLAEAGRKTLIFKEQLRQCEEASKGIDKTLNALGKSAIAVSAAGAAAVTAFAKESLDTYKDFQQSMSSVAGIMAIDSTSKEYEVLEEAARKAGASTSKNAKDSADALSYMALAGWSVEDSLQGLMPVLRASEASGSDLATTSDLITDSMSAMGLQVGELNTYLDVCTTAQNKSNTSLTQMQEAYIACGGTLKSLNTDMYEGGALLGVLANRGIKGAEAGNKLQSLLVNFVKQGGQSYKALNLLGLSAHDSQGKFKGVANVLMELHEKTKNLTEEQRNNYLTMIGGKEQLVTLNALMAGLTNETESGKTEFEALRGELENSNGSLDRMAKTMTDNYAGALEQASGATDELKLTIGERLEPYAKNFMLWFADNLPEATEKFAIWLDSKIPKALNAGKKAMETFAPAVKFVADNMGEIAGAGIGVITALKAFTILSKINGYVSKFNSVLKGASTAQKIATALQIGFNSSLLACPVTWIAAGLGVAVGGIIAFNKHMEKVDIEKHFGNIGLTAEDCGDIVKNVFGTELINDINDARAATEEFENSLKGVSDGARQLNKINFKIKMGDNVSREDYLATVDDYLANLQNAIRDKQYSLKMNLDLLLDGTELGKELTDKGSAYYSELTEKANKLGEDLKAAVKTAYEKGWDLDSTQAVEAILKQQAEIEQKLAETKGEAKLEALKSDFVVSDLSKESFDTLLNTTKEELENMRTAYNESRVSAIALAKQTYAEGSAELNAAIEGINQEYYEKLGGLTAKGLKFMNDAIMEAYPEIGEAMESAMDNAFNSVYLHFSEKTLNAIGNGQQELSDEIVSVISESFDYSFSSLPGAARKHIGEFYESLAPTTEELKTIIKGMEKVPDSMAKVFVQSSAIGAVSGNAEALKDTTVTTLSMVLPEDVTKIMEGSQKYGESFAKGIDCAANRSLANTHSQNLIDFVKNKLAKPISLSDTYGPLPGGSLPGIKSNATGTTYFGGGLTTINEHGYEVIDLPQGSRIYPHSAAEKMTEKKQSINVSVNVAGNIFGLDNAADIIGDMVCSRIVEAVRAV